MRSWKTGKTSASQNRNNYFLRKYFVFSIAVIASYLFGFVQDFLITPENSQIKGIAVIKDGDTLKVAGRDIRIYGIDAPELKQQCYDNNKKVSCGVEAKNKLSDIIGSNEIFCSDLDTDKYNRTNGNCYFTSKSGEKINVGQKLVSSGYALAYQTYSLRFVLNELYAKTTLSGIWRYQFQKPWNWRRAHKHGH